MRAPPRLAEHPDLARVRPDDVHEDANERALAGAVRSEQAEDLAGMDVEGDAAKRRGVSVALRDVVEREDDHVPKSLLEVTRGRNAARPSWRRSISG